MATIQRNLACEEYAKGYIELTDTRKNTFSRLCNKLLNDNFIYAYRQEDRNDYYEILSMKKLIENYFSMMDFDLVHVDSYKLFYIQTNADRNRIRLKKLDTVIVLVFRLLYHKGSLDINSSSDISTTLGKMITEINQTGIFKSQPSMTDYMESLRLLKRYKLIDYNFKDFKEDNVIVIYPTILYVAKVDSINMLNDKLKTYIAVKGDDEDEVEED
ncbi:MAG: DUF4194 domain-containing protein [Bacilli bacterium]|nr:DUF4194 domain-containing protein [Bacilli bacterium]